MKNFKVDYVIIGTMTITANSLEEAEQKANALPKQKFMKEVKSAIKNKDYIITVLD